MRKHFDYIFAGTGMAAFSLVCRMIDDPFYSDKKILLIDRDAKTENDRTWSFWEREPGYFNAVVYKTWNRALVKTAGWEKVLELEPYQYKVIRGADFYAFAWKKIQASKNIQFVQGDILSIEANEKPTVHTASQQYTAGVVFNSLFNQKELVPDGKHPLLFQHFKGYVVETKQAIDDGLLTFMDFSIPQNNTMQFMYVLPYGPNTCLVEHTYFSKHFVDESTYDEALQRYCDIQFGKDSWEIQDVEKGVIPMTTIPIRNEKAENIIPIGTRGGFTKASSGYTFHFVQKEATQILDSLKQGKPYHKSRTRFNVYDALLLRVLAADEAFGHELFSKLFQQHKLETVFSFLNEESTLAQELAIILKSPRWRFVKALLAELKA